MNKPIGKELVIPALVCAGLSVVFMRAGFLTIFFLVPLGVCAVVCGPAAAWLGAVLATVANGVWSARFAPIGLDALYFAVLALGFVWVMAGSPPRPALPPMRTMYRGIAAASAGAVVFLGVIFSLGRDEAFAAALRSQIETIAASYIAAAGNDAAQQAFLEQTLTPDRIIDLFAMIILRGGALVSALFLLFFSRQTAFIIARLFRRPAGSVTQDLISFHVPRRAMGVLTLCLPAIVLCRITGLEKLEIAAWNVLVMCATMFLAQGGGIVLFNLARRQWPSLTRLLCGVLVLFVLFSPGINVLVLVVLMLLGVAENWLPLRVIKVNDVS